MATITRRCADIHPTLRPAECSTCRGFTPSASARRPAPAPVAPRLALPCVHLGPPTGERRPLLNCQADPPTTVPLRACAIHGVCTEEHGVRGKPQCCRYCSDRSVGEPEVTASGINYRPPLAGWADRIVVINLDRRPDRLRDFAAQAGRFPELAGWVRVPAADGRALRPSPGWRGGPGAAGCRASHLRVLADALRDGIGTLAVFEDDARFAPDFSGRLAAFLAATPADWQGLLLGCEGQAAAPAVGPGVRRVVNAQRTHAYVVRGRGAIESLLALWSVATTHIDHHWYVWQQARPVYQPDPLLCGQGAGQSDIVWRVEHERWWQGDRR